MAEENPPRSAPEAAKESPLDSSPLKDTVYSPPSYRNPKKRKTFLILAIVVVVLVSSIFLWRYFSSYESTDDAQADVHLYPVSARISGYVVKVNVDDNQWVEKGAVLVEIDPKDYEVAVAQAQANMDNAIATAQSLNITVPITSVNTSSQLKSAASDIVNANAGIIAAQRQLTAAHAQLEAAEANDVRAQDDLHRYKLLVDKREVAEQVYDQALATAKSSTAAVAAARANESAAQQFIEQAQSRLAQADASHQYAATGPQQVSSTRARVRAALAIPSGQAGRVRQDLPGTASAVGHPGLY
ncbi:MAG: HlyD family secretion protein [Candidatus Acidiferrales bacterium]